MTNNLEDFEQPDLEPGAGGLPPNSGVRANLTHAWRTRPLFKLLVLMIVAGAIIAVGMSLFSGSKPVDVTKLTAPPGGLKQAPGGSSSPYFIEQTKKAEKEREDAAIQNNGSALPTPIGANTSIDEMTAEKQKKDPLVELRAQLELQRQKIAQMEQRQPQAQAKQPEAFDDSLAQAMQRQLQQMQGNWDAKGIKQVEGKPDQTADDKTKKKDGTADTGTADAGAGFEPPVGNVPKTSAAAIAAQSKKFGVPIISAGTVSYAQLLTEANSDTPGPILAQILSGPLSGARAVGSFKVENDYLVLTFSLANLKGVDYHINSIALDPDTTLGGMATEVDERYFTRVLLPAAAGFMQGFGSALGQGDQSLVTNGTTTIVQQSGRSVQQGIYTGIGQAGQSMATFFQNEANNTKPLVRVAAGTPMGLFFTSTVCDGTGCSLANMVEGRQSNNYVGGYPAGPMPGQVGNGYANGNNGSSPAGYYPGMPTTGYNGEGAGTGTASNVPYPNASVPYPSNSNMPTNQLTNPLNTPTFPNNNGLNTLTGVPGIGTTVINP